MSAIKQTTAIPLSDFHKTEKPYAVCISERYSTNQFSKSITFDRQQLSHFNFQKPTIVKSKTAYRYSVSKPIASVKISKIKQQKTMPLINELTPFMKRLYRFKLTALVGLEKMFAGNSKITSLLNSIKTQYE